MIAVRGLSKRFVAAQRRVAAVNGISFDVGEGEVFVLLGASGCGKSTTLRCLAGLEMPDAGEISLDGDIVSSAERRVFVPPEARRIAMVFQSYAVWPHMTVLENVVFPLTDGRLHLGKQQAIEQARHALERVRLGGLEDRPTTQLSGGQQQRVALARALALEPRVLLMDEPLSNLDAALREHMREDLKTLFGELGLTVVYVTHDQVEALSLATRVAVMHEGELLQVGAPEEVYERPANLTVLTFFGNCNVVAGEIAGPGEVQTAFGAVKCAAAGSHSRGETVTLAIRPDEVRLAANQPEGNGYLPAVVSKRTFLGDYVQLEASVNDVPVKLRTPRGATVRAGDAVWLQFPADKWQVVPPGVKA